MNYCTKEELIIFLSKDKKNIVFYKNILKNSESFIEESIIFSNKIINFYLKKRYSIPFSKIPVGLKNIALHLTYHKWLFLKYKKKISNKYEKIFLNNIKILKALQDGTITLGMYI